MQYLILGIAAVVIIGCIIALIVSYKKQDTETRYKALKEIVKELEQKSAEESAYLQELHQQETYLNEKIVKMHQEYQVAAQRAADAKVSTDRLLAAEQERAAASLKGVKQLEEERMKHEFEIKEAALEQAYKWRKQQFEEDFEVLLDFYHGEVDIVKSELDEYQAKREAINQAILRERELEEQEDFYRINLKDNDIQDILVLRSIESRLINKEVLNRLIYETFIKRPLSEMQKRILQGRKVGGIYKITYIKTGESYIGRSVDIANRWKEHVLSSLNIGTIAHSTFHNILAEKGLQNFTWEILEEVEKEKQSSREKYWIEFYHTDKQFNSKAGG